jgi:predicted secreted protein
MATTYEGSAGQVKIGESGSETAVASVRSWNLDITREVVEDTAMGDGNRTYKKGLQDYSGSMDIVYDSSEATAVKTGLTPDTDTAINIELYSDVNDVSSKFAGAVIVTSYSITASYDGLTEASVSFQGTGALTTSNI